MNICGQCDMKLESATSGDPRQGIGTALLLGLWRAASRFLHQRKLYRARRRAFRGLLSLDDQMLFDIGVTREELLSADALPLSINAADELHRVSLMRRRSEQLGRAPR